jgi:peptidoglycan-associated lipoprotein
MQFKHTYRLIFILGLIAVLSFAVGCKKKPKPDDPSLSEYMVDGAPDTEGQDASIDADSINVGDAALDNWIPDPNSEGVMVDELPVIYFDFDKYDLKSSEMKKIDDYAAPYFKSNPTAHIQIEGHCDERGTEEYNLTLGEKRAMAVRQYLIDSGLNAEYLHVISYGEERPVDPGQSESAYSLNRRVQFLVYFSE